MPTVARFSVTPVKSLALSHPHRIRLERWGAVGNRRFYIATPDGALFNNSKHGPLMQVRAEWDPESERLELHFPNGQVCRGDGASVGRVIRTSFFGRMADGVTVAGGFDDALSTFVGRPVVLARTREPGDANDEAPVSIVSTASSEELARRSGSDAALDSRRFRMLIEVAGSAPHEEDSWVGRRIGIGEAQIVVVARVKRCVITTKDPDTGQKDFDSLKAIASYRSPRDLPFGVYAEVVEPGIVRLGDELEPLDDGAAATWSGRR